MKFILSISIYILRDDELEVLFVLTDLGLKPELLLESMILRVELYKEIPISAFEDSTFIHTPYNLSISII